MYLSLLINKGTEIKSFVEWLNIIIVLTDSFESNKWRQDAKDQ